MLFDRPRFFTPPGTAFDREDRARDLAAYLHTEGFHPGNFATLVAVQIQFGPQGRGWTAAQASDAINDLHASRFLRAVYLEHEKDVVPHGILLYPVEDTDGPDRQAGFVTGAPVTISETFWGTDDDDEDEDEHEYDNGDEQDDDPHREEILRLSCAACRAGFGLEGEDIDLIETSLGHMYGRRSLYDTERSPEWAAAMAELAYRIVVATPDITWTGLLLELHQIDCRVYYDGFGLVVDALSRWGYAFWPDGSTGGRFVRVGEAPATA